MGILKGFFSKKEKDSLYKLCERYISCCDNNDGYWVTDTEIQMYKELKNRLIKMKIIK